MSVHFDPKELKPHPKNAEIYEERVDQDFEKSILENGILEPLVVNSQNVILSGARRWKAALKLGLEKVPCRIEDSKDEVKAIIEYNRYRQKTSRELYNEKRRLEERLKPEAMERMLAGKPVPISAQGELGRVRDQITEELNVSHGKLDEIGYIYSHEHEDAAKPVVEKLDREEISVHQAFTEIKKATEPKAGIEPKTTWKCGACLQEQEADIEPVNITICPDCVMDFQTWKADKQT